VEWCGPAFVNGSAVYEFRRVGSLGSIAGIYLFNMASGPVSSMLGGKHWRVVMYTIEGLLAKDSHAVILASGKDLDEVRKKAASFRKKGTQVGIWDEKGVKVNEPETELEYQLKI